MPPRSHSVGPSRSTLQPPASLEKLLTALIDRANNPPANSINFDIHWKDTAAREPGELLIVRATTKDLAQLLHNSSLPIVRKDTDHLIYIIKNLLEKSPNVTDMRPAKQPRTRAKCWDFTISLPSKSTPSCLREIMTTWGQTPAAPISKLDHNLPHRPHRELLDRAAAIRQIHQWLQNSPQHLISIEGMGGIGKTALALEIAHQYLQHHPDLPRPHPTFDAIIFVSVPSRQSPRWLGHPTAHSLHDVFRAIHYTLTGLFELPGTTADQIQHLHHVIRQRHPLILVDNLESLAEQGVLLDFLRGIPTSAKVIITSREHLGLPQTIYLQPIPTAIITPYLKKQLKERGVEIPNTKTIATAIAGSPFAMEHILSNIATSYHSPRPFQLPQNLQHSIDFIHEFCFSSSLRSLQTAHNSSALTVLFSLSLFFYPVSTDTLAQVTQLSSAVLHQSLTQLRQLHLVINNIGDPSDSEHPLANHILPLHSLIHSYITTQLDQEPARAQQLRQQWLAYYQNFAATHGTSHTPPMKTRYWLEWYDYSPLIADWQNLRAAVDWCVAENRYEDVINFCQSLNGFTVLTGQWQERQQWNDYLLAEAQQRQDGPIQAEAVFQAGLTLAYINEADPEGIALELAQEAWQQRQHCSIDWQFNVATLLAILYLRKPATVGTASLPDQNCLQAAAEFIQQAQAIAATLPPSGSLAAYYQCQVLYFEAELDCLRSQPTAALAKYQQALKLARSIAYQRCIAYCTGRSAKVLFELEKFDQAKDFLLTALAQAEKYHDRRSSAFCYFYLCKIALQQQQPDQATQYAQQARKIFTALGMYREADMPMLALGSV